MENHKFQSGAFVFSRIKGLLPRDPDDLRVLAGRHGFDLDQLPAYAGDRMAFTRAINHASAGLWKEGFLLRPIKRSNGEVVYGIVREQKDVVIERVDHNFEARIRWSAEPDPTTIEGAHPIGRRVAEAYSSLRGKIVADDWSSSITAFLESHDAARMRGDGRVYYVPPQRVDAVKKFGAFLQEVGIDLILCELEPEVQQVVQEVANESLDESLEKLQQEADSFNGTQKPSTYSKRLEDYQRMRERAILYRDALGVGVSKAETVLQQLEQKVTGLLGIRRQTVVHRNRTITANEAKPTEDSATEPVSQSPSIVSPTLRFGGASFRLDSAQDNVMTFVSDDQAAKSTVKMMETMGLAGRWQQAGQARVRIQNSGPIGAAVSIQINLPNNSNLKNTAPSLSSWGIELGA